MQCQTKAVWYIYIYYIKKKKNQGSLDLLVDLFLSAPFYFFMFPEAS